MSTPVDIEITGPRRERFDEVLTPEALDFLACCTARSTDGVSSFSRQEPVGTTSSPPAALLTSSPRPRRSAATTAGGWPSRHRVSWTVAPRSPGRPTRR